MSLRQINAAPAATATENTVSTTTTASNASARNSSAVLPTPPPSPAVPTTPGAAGGHIWCNIHIPYLDLLTCAIYISSCFFAVVTTADPIPDVAAQYLTAKMVVRHDDAYLPKFLAYWETQLPDLTDLPKFDPDQLSFWVRHRKRIKKKGKRVKVKKPHRLLNGVCAKWLNMSLDWAIKHNKWPVRMYTDSDVTDLTIPFILVVWVYYAAHMYTHPALTSNACQKVLKYLLSNTESVVSAWRHRLYNYSSGSIMLVVEQGILDWFEEGDTRTKKKSLRRLSDYNGELFPLVSECFEIATNY